MYSNFRFFPLITFRYCLFGLNVGLTEKFEANSKPMRIHVSDPCKMLLDDRYVLEERTEGAELADKVCVIFIDSSQMNFIILLLLN